MRDLQEDLEICNKATQGPWEATSESDEDVRVCQIENEECVCCLALMGDYNWEKEEWKEGSIKQWNKDAEFIAAAREGWPHAIERAIKAEAEVERLRLMVKSITGGLDEAIEAVHYLEAENALLRKVADAAGEFISSTGCNSKECKKCDPKYINFCKRSGIGRVLAELDEESSHD